MVMRQENGEQQSLHEARCHNFRCQSRSMKEAKKSGGISVRMMNPFLISSLTPPYHQHRHFNHLHRRSHHQLDRYQLHQRSLHQRRQRIQHHQHLNHKKHQFGLKNNKLLSPEMNREFFWSKLFWS